MFEAGEGMKAIKSVTGPAGEAGRGGSSANRFPHAGSQPGATGSQVGASREAGGSGCEELDSSSQQGPSAGSCPRQDQRLPKSLLLGSVAVEPEPRGPSMQPVECGWHLKGEGGAEPLSHGCRLPARGHGLSSSSSSFPSQVCRRHSAPLRMPRIRDFRPDVSRQCISSRDPGLWCSPGMSRTALDAELGTTEGPGVGPARAVQPPSWKNSPGTTSALPFGEETGQ
ncbi:uncharacterized protein ACIBXB_002032 isoform 3-T3 [Morphnus guianensis]